MHRSQGDTSPPAVRIVPWGPEDLSLLEKVVGDPAMMNHLGGVESPEKIAERQARYERSETGVFKIVAGASAEGVGWVGYWDRIWQGAEVYEMGWSVIPAFQGRGIALTASELALAEAHAEGRHRFVHAFPSPHNGPSNAICRKLGFTLLGECEVEFPPGHLAPANDWRGELTRLPTGFGAC